MKRYDHDIDQAAADVLAVLARMHWPQHDPIDPHGTDEDEAA